MHPLRAWEQSLPHTHPTDRFTFTVGMLAGVTGKVGAVNGFSSAATFNSPYGLVLDLRGSLIVCDSGNNMVRRALRDATYEIEYLQVRGVAWCSSAHPSCFRRLLWAPFPLPPPSSRSVPPSRGAVQYALLAHARWLPGKCASSTLLCALTSVGCVISRKRGKGCCDCAHPVPGSCATCPRPRGR